MNIPSLSQDKKIQPNVQIAHKEYAHLLLESDHHRKQVSDVGPFKVVHHLVVPPWVGSSWLYPLPSAVRSQIASPPPHPHIRCSSPTRSPHPSNEPQRDTYKERAVPRVILRGGDHSLGHSEGRCASRSAPNAQRPWAPLLPVPPLSARRWVPYHVHKKNFTRNSNRQPPVGPSDRTVHNAAETRGREGGAGGVSRV
ncbi:hypothetical protein J5N97_021703 [Dioscorea zingiberensis]|uniref:Uncharacterized protein n=1 Tax=Dioscorea zingiberensis TaxID=325984 RepID=A0A9D5C931_9LILI|nr:hypothetical protein J5N97_021703 [Dioscorea zingiberensis]